MHLPHKSLAEATDSRCFGVSNEQQSRNVVKPVGYEPVSSLHTTQLRELNPRIRGLLSQFSSLFVFFIAMLSINDVFGSDQKPVTKIVRLFSPWQRGSAPGSSFEISAEGSRLKIRGEVVDATLVDPIRDGAALDDTFNDCILFAWARSPLALEFEGVEIFPDGQFKTLRKELSKKEFESNIHLLPEIQVTKTANGFRFECDIVVSTDDAFDAANNAPLYISLYQIDASRDGNAPRWYCSSIPATLGPERFHSSSFAMIDSFPSEKQDVSVPTDSVSSSFRIAELELRNKWNQYAKQPSGLILTQKWYDDITTYPDAERFLERTREGDRLNTIDLSDERTPKKLTDARSEKMSQLLGQSWGLHLGRIEDLSTSLPLAIRTSKYTGKETLTESLVMWLESDRIQIAMLQNGEGVFWGSASWPIEQIERSERVKSITLASDGSTNGVGFELYANFKPLEMTTHNVCNLRLQSDSPFVSEINSKLNLVDWDIKTMNADLEIDLYNTKLTPIEILSLDPSAMLLSWSELSEEQREAWRIHYVFCIDPEGRYFLESLKHYTSSQAELLRRSRKPAKK